jgi:hypothetical protein
MEQSGEVFCSPTSTPTDPISPSTLIAPTGSASFVETSSISTITANLPLQQAVPSNAQPLNSLSTPLFSVPLSTQPSGLTLVGNGVDLWTRAYEIFQEQEPELIIEYKKHLGDTATSADLSNRQAIETILEKLLKDREKKQWEVPFLGHDIRIRKQVERLTNFLIWSDKYVKHATSAQPYAALAWSGVSLLLPASCI